MNVLYLNINVSPHTLFVQHLQLIFASNQRNANNGDFLSTFFYDINLRGGLYCANNISSQVSGMDREMGIKILTFYLLTFSNVPSRPFIMPASIPTLLITHLIVCCTHNGLLIKHVGVPNLKSEGNLLRRRFNQNILR